MAEARDRTIEAACANMLVKPRWTEMKQNAAAAADSDAGMAMLARHQLEFKRQLLGLEIYLTGHCAGAIVLGHLFSLLDQALSAASLPLFSPACSVGFAVHHLSDQPRRRRRHKTPLLVMEWAWKAKGRPQNQWASDQTTDQALAAWSVLAKKMTIRLHTRKREYISTGTGWIRLALGSFDNDLKSVSACGAAAL